MCSALYRYHANENKTKALVSGNAASHMQDNTRGVIAFSYGVSIRPQSRRGSKKGIVLCLEGPEESEAGGRRGGQHWAGVGRVGILWLLLMCHGDKVYTFLLYFLPSYFDFPKKVFLWVENHSAYQESHGFHGII